MIVKGDIGRTRVSLSGFREWRIRSTIACSRRCYNKSSGELAMRHYIRRTSLSECSRGRLSPSRVCVIRGSTKSSSKGVCPCVCSGPKARGCWRSGRAECTCTKPSSCRRLRCAKSTTASCSKGVCWLGSKRVCCAAASKCCIWHRGESSESKHCSKMNFNKQTYHQNRLFARQERQSQ